MSKYYNGLRVSNEFCDCALPLTFDQYKKCGFGCLYCFARYQRENNPMCRDYKSSEVKTVDVDYVKKLFLGHYPDHPYYKYWIKRKKVIQWGSMADPFCPFEERFGLGYELLEFFAELEYPIRFSTKSVLYTKGKYWKLLKDNADRLADKWAFIESIVTYDENVARVLEAGVPTPEERFNALKKVKELGYYTAHRLRPIIPFITEKTLDEMLEKDKEINVDAISIEWFCLDVRAGPLQRKMYSIISRLAGQNIVSYYKLHSYQQGYLRLNPKVKKKTYMKIYNFCKKNGITFACSDPHCKHLNDTGCCCGLPDKGPLSNFCRLQWTQVIRDMHKERKAVKLSDYAKKYPDDEKFLSSIKAYEPIYIERNYRKVKNQTLLDEMKNRWNHPKKGSSPYKYFYGRMYPVRNEKGELVYVYKDKEKKEDDEK